MRYASLSRGVRFDGLHGVVKLGEGKEYGDEKKGQARIREANGLRIWSYTFFFCYFDIYILWSFLLNSYCY